MTQPVVKEFQADSISVEEISRLLGKRTPFVVRNWLPEAKDFLADPIWQYEPSLTMTLPEGERLVISNAGSQRNSPLVKEQNFAEAFETVKNQTGGRKYYLFGNQVPKILVNKLKWPAEVRRGHVYAASEGVRTKAHIDIWDVMHIQCVGEKKWWVAPPGDYPYLYVVIDPHKNIFRRCLVDLDDPDLEQYPQFKKANFTQVTTRAGDLFYLPPLWWHEVEAKTFSVSLNAVIPHSVNFHYLVQLRWSYYAFISEYLYGTSKKRQVDKSLYTYAQEAQQKYE